VPRGVLKKDENQRRDLFEDLAGKNLQWEPPPENYENTNPISSKGGLHSIESFITTEAKISSLMRKMEALETKEPVLVNQVSPN